MKVSKFVNFLLISFTTLFASSAFSDELAKVVEESLRVVDQVESVGDEVILAQKKKKRSSKRSRPKNLIKEKTIKFKKGAKNATNLDFDAADISGQTKNPYGTGVRGTTNNKGYDFIWIRKKWHPEMFQSASSLDAGY